MAYKGKFYPKNIEKYQGDPTKIIYRSLWERKFMHFCDININIIKWSSEEISIPYVSIDGKIHNYFVDFWISVNTKNGIETFLIEIKPMKECQPPKIKNNLNLSKKELNEIKKWNINKKKWAHAKKFAEEKNWKFKILTENHLNIK